MVPMNLSQLRKQSPMFLGTTLTGLHSCFELQKTSYSISGQKGGAFFDVDCATKNSEARYGFRVQPMMYRYHPCTSARRNIS